MYSNKFFIIERCSVRSSLRIILPAAAITVLGIVFTIYSPFEYLFHKFGYLNSNGCPMLTLAKIPCPLCGMGRSFWSIVSLDFGKSIYYNPSSFFFFPFTGIILGGIFLPAIFGYRVKLTERALGLWYVFAGVVVVMWVVNIFLGHH